MIRHLLGIILGTLVPCIVLSQTPSWEGNWEMKYQPWPHIPPITMNLQIATGVKGMLYPAKLNLSYGSFEAGYELLLVRKNDRQIGIGRNKYPFGEVPYSLGPWMMYLNGTFDYQQEGQEDHLLLKRLWIDNFGIFMKGLYDDELFTNQKAYIRDFLYRADITLKRTSAQPWTGAGVQHVLHADSIYYGIYDPVTTDMPLAHLAVQDEERYDRDSVTIVHNGRQLAQGLAIEKVTEMDDLLLDTGENYIAFFADNYGDLPPNTANFMVGTGGDRGSLYSYDFSDKSNAFATVMVARLQYRPAKAKPSVSGHTAMPYTLGRRDIQLGSIKVSSALLLLEFWDEQVEDGDIVSLLVNGFRIAKEVTVSKTVQQIRIKLQPGLNRIVFRAENLGRIPPNTAALRIIAGTFSKEMRLNTDLKTNNVLELMLE